MTHPRSPRILGLFLAALTHFGVGCGGSAGAPAVGQAVDPAVDIATPAAPPADRDLAEWARLAVEGDETLRAEAIAQLRRAQQRGLAALASAHRDARSRLLAGERTRELELVREAFDEVAAQRDAHVGLLFWHTDIEAAKREARSSDKPILSLRMLGRLDEEMSCANSRFFRIALYSNEEIAAHLREHFVLHWASERPVPRVTIDMGDGRTIERTITGNSIHYVLDAEGRPLEAIPGLYGPKGFADALTRARGLAQSLEDAGDFWEARVRGYHARERDRLAYAWQTQLQLVGAAPTPPPAPRPRIASAPSAAAAVPIAMPKAMAEAPIIRGLGLGDVVPLPTPLEADAWGALVERELADNRLDERSRALVQVKLGAGAAAAPSLIASFERAMAEDMVQNEYALHRTLHEWLSQTPATTDLEQLNTRVYADLFLTPRSDPWLGLNPTDVYTAIEAPEAKTYLGQSARPQ